MSNESIEGIIRRIIREELEAHGFTLVKRINGTAYGLRRSAKQIVGQQEAILKLLEMYPAGLTSREITDLLYEDALGSKEGWNRCVVQAVHELKKRGDLDADKIGKVSFRFRLPSGHFPQDAATREGASGIAAASPTEGRDTAESPTRGSARGTPK